MRSTHASGDAARTHTRMQVYYYLNEAGSEFVAFDFELEAAADSTVKLRTSVAMKVKVNDEGDLSKVAVISDTLAASEALAKVKKA